MLTVKEVIEALQHDEHYAAVVSFIETLNTRQRALLLGIVQNLGIRNYPRNLEYNFQTKEWIKPRQAV